MEVNRQWWDGTARELYIEGTVGETPVITTCPNLETLVRANLSKYQGVEWDKSICPWKINSNSDFFKFQWANPYYKKRVSGTIMAQSPLFKERKKGYTFYISAAGGGGSALPHEIVNANACTKPLWKTCLSNDELDLTNTDIDYWFNLKYRHIFPVINFDYSRIFVAPMIHKESGSGWVFYDSPELRTNWDSTAVYGISLMFYGKSRLGSTYPICAGLFSLNNKFAQPQWDTTNCWKEDTMFDNALAVAWSNAWNGYDGYTVGGIQTVGSNTLWGTDTNNPGFADQTFANENAAGAVMYFPMKNIIIETPADTEDTIWSTDWDNFYLGGGYTQGTKRHLKSGITYDEFANYLKQQLAYLGFRFCIDAKHLDDDINSQYFFIPVIDEKGVTTGGFYQANSAEAETLPNYNWTNDVYTETPYNGTDDEEDDDPNDYDETLTTDLNPYAATYHSKFLNYYRLDSAALRSVIDYVYTNLPTNQPETDFLTNNPIDSIVSLMMFPFRVDWQEGWYYPFFGKVKCTTASVHIPKSHIQIIDCGQHLFYPHFGENDFRNYTPYTSAELYLPYCGNVKIEPTIYLNKLIGIKYIVDLITGACTALIFRAEKGAQNYGLLTEMINGQIGITLPTTGVKSNDLQRDILNKQAAYRQASNTAMISGANAALSLFSMAANPSVSGAVGALNSVLNWDSATERQNIANYDVKHIQVPFSVKGSASSICALAEEPTPYLTIRYAKMLPEYNAEIYAHTVGYACIINDLISNYSGYAEITGVDLSGIVATDEEKAIIKNYLESGVYL